MKLELDDEARRLTGPNLLWSQPGAIVDVFIDGIAKQTVVDKWQAWMDKILPELGWYEENTTYRLHKHGASLAVSAPLDALYTACEVTQVAYEMTQAEITGSALPDLEQRIEVLKAELKQESHPELLALMKEADRNGVSWLTDDDDFSLGMGESSQTWPIDALPQLQQIDWALYKDVPIGLVTGTNGKSTSVRLALQIAATAGVTAGVTSTDFIRVGNDIIDRGDYSGPGGARMLLRDRRTQAAFLEVARGGILRRGLPITKANAALITNVAEDHLGQYGIDTVEELAQTKFVVSSVMGNSGVLVLNADDNLVVEMGAKLNCSICWFSTDQNNTQIQQQLSTGGRAVFVKEGNIYHHANGALEFICPVADIPITFSGRAKHNIQNALGVVGLAKALNFDQSDIVKGLMSFSSDAEDNPGRGNLYRVNGCDVIVDFAHNEHSMKAVVDLAKQMPANNRLTMFGHGGDRSDDEIRNLTKAIAELKADFYIATEVEEYLRGREYGEVPQITKRCLIDSGIPESKIAIAEDAVSATKLALEQSQPGDVILLFVLSGRDEVSALLKSME